MSSGMESDKSAVVFGPVIVVTIFLGLGVSILIFILKWIKQERSEKGLNDDTSGKAKIAESSASNRSSKKEQTGNQKSKKKLADRELRRATEKGFNHPWMLVTLKGHSGRVLDMDFSANEKYLVSSADEEPDPGEKLCFKRNKRKVLQRRPKKNSILSSSSTSSSNSSLDLCSSPPSPTTRAKGLSRRQRKNASKKNRGVKLLEENLPNSETRMSWERHPFLQDGWAAYRMKYPPLEEYKLLNIPESQFAKILRKEYVMPEGDLGKYGYPLRLKKKNNKVPLFSISPRENLNANTMMVCYPDSGYGQSTDIQPRAKKHLDINAAEFVPSSGCSSAHSSCTTTDDEIYINEGRRLYPKSIMDGQSTYPTEQEDLICARCGSLFSVYGPSYLTIDRCCYHPGKLRNHNNPFGPMEHTCCGQDQNSPGCEWGNLHVWNGPKEPIVDDSFVESKRSKFGGNPNRCGVLAIDCEMSYTVKGLEVVKVAIVDMQGAPIYVHYVRPTNQIIDFNTRYSGIVAEDFLNNPSKSLQEVQQDLLVFISSDTILIGHGLENDLKGLKFIHKKVVDTAFTFPHYYGLPFKRSLRNLVETCLKKSTQCGTLGHNPCEDARNAMELMLFRVRGDLKYKKTKQLETNLNSRTRISN